jgi:hypothetical protein
MIFQTGKLAIGTQCLGFCPEVPCWHNVKNESFCYNLHDFEENGIIQNISYSQRVTTNCQAWIDYDSSEHRWRLNETKRPCRLVHVTADIRQEIYANTTSRHIRF